MNKYVFSYECAMDIYADTVEDAEEAFIWKLPPEGYGYYELGDKTIKYVIHDASTDVEVFEDVK